MDIYISVEPFFPLTHPVLLATDALVKDDRYVPRPLVPRRGNLPTGKTATNGYWKSSAALLAGVVPQNNATCVRGRNRESNQMRFRQHILSLRNIHDVTQNLLFV
jgi:hypothetical protein